MPETPDNMLDRIPPQALEAERSLIGALLMDGARTGDVLHLVNRDCFVRKTHAIIYDAIVTLYAETGGAVDLVILRDHLRQRKLLDAVGGIEVAAEIVEAAPASDHAPYYAGIVREKHDQRQVIQAATDMLRNAYGEIYPAATNIALAIERLTQIAAGGPDASVVSLHGAAVDAVEHLGRVSRGEEPPGLLFQLPTLDRQIGGLGPGELVMIGADTSHGKTTLAMNLVERAVLLANAKALVFSLEMTPRELGQRMLQSSTRTDGEHLRLPGLKNITDDDWLALRQAAEAFRDNPSTVDSRARTMPDISASARRHAIAWDGLDLLVIDYLQLVHSEGESFERQVAHVTRSSKELAKDMGCPVLLLGQFNRAGVNRGGPPSMHDFKGSGSIEQDANVVLLLWMDESEQGGLPSGVFQVQAKIDKNRGGPTTSWGERAMRLWWYRGQMRFDEPDPLGGARNDW